ncbi:MAG: sulfatase, partial [Acidimicrobiales bacterium]|nr:sulfatase [Acidimicrobiales bacterium]
NVIDKDGKYIRGVEGEQTDVSVWSNRWSTMPVHAFPRLSLARPDDRATLDHMPGSDVPVIRQPFTADDLNSGAVYLAGRTAGHGSVSELYDASDTDESEDLADSSRSAHYVDLLHHALTEVEAPAEQFVRLGLD